MKPKSRLFLALLTALAFPNAANAQRLIPSTEIPTSGTKFQLVQSEDNSYRVNELENLNRKLNGRVEELNFLLLELQEKFRKMEEENELRFQEIEDKLSQSSGEPKQNLAANNTEQDRLGKPEASGKLIPDDNTSEESTNQANENSELATLPRALGTLTFDKDGNVVDSKPLSGGKELTKLPGIFNDGVDGGVEAAEFGPTPSAVLTVGKSAIKNRRYKRGEQAMAAYLKAWPKDPNLGEARYYLATSLFWQKKYYDAANTHLETHNTFPDAKTAPDNLLGLGLALAGLNQREVACATYAEVLNQYPKAKKRLGSRIKDEQTSTRC